MSQINKDNRKTPPHACIDYDLGRHQLHESVRHAIKENPSNNPARKGTPEHKALAKVLANPRAKLTPQEAGHVQRMAIVTKKMWGSGRTLTIAFLDGSATQKTKVKAHALKWTKLANIKFKFVRGKKATIRISFVADDGSWSTIGTDANTVPSNEPSMNFGWLRDDTAENEYERVVVHEFGHALGCIHEHQNPAGGIKWNKPVVYKYYQGPPNNWSKADVDSNLFAKYSANQTQFTKLDPRSIMMYPIPKEFTLDGFEVGLNTTVSATDKSFIKKEYQ